MLTHRPTDIGLFARAGLLLLMTACSDGPTAPVEASAPPGETVNTGVPELGAAAPTVPLSVFESLILRASDDYRGQTRSAELDADTVGTVIATLARGPLAAGEAQRPSEHASRQSDFGALAVLPPFLVPGERRNSWPDWLLSDATLQMCERGAIRSRLIDEATADAQPYLQLQLTDCERHDVVVNGTILIERPDNALQRPTRIAYDDLTLTTEDGQQRITGTVTWTNGDECGVGERRRADLLITDNVSGAQIWLHPLESYTTAAPVLHDCGEALDANAWRGEVSYGDLGAVSIDTNIAFSHDWNTLPRVTNGDVLFGAAVAPEGHVILTGAERTRADWILTNTDTDGTGDSVTTAITLQTTIGDVLSFVSGLSDARYGDAAVALTPIP